MLHPKYIRRGGVAALAVGLAATQFGCGGTKSELDAAQQKLVDEAAEMLSTSPELGSFGVDLGTRDLTVRPQDDFFRYANGTWLNEFEIPADLPSYGSFTKLYLRSEAQIQTIIEEAAMMKPASAVTLEQKVGALYRDYLDTKAIEAAGLKPLAGHFERVRAAKTHEDVARLFGEWSRIGVPSPFGSYVTQDAKNPDVNLAHLYQGGLTLPDRDYYLVADNPRFAVAREAFVEYLTFLFGQAELKDAAERAQRVLELETELAESHWASEETRDRDRTYNVMSASEIKALAPGFPWDAYLTTAGMAGQERYIVMQPSAFTGLAKSFGGAPVSVWRDVLIYRLLASNSSLLPQAIDQAAFKFSSTAMTGSERQRDREKRGVQFVNGAVGQALGKLYVERHFSPVAKERMDELVSNLLVAMGERIDGLDWMSAETKTKAHDKLSKFVPKIGYPDKWRDYSKLEIHPGDLIGNAMSARAFSRDYNLAKLDKPVDRDEWFMSAQTVNAYYNPGLNEIVFPAAILQPPFFDEHADDAVNYGAIGAVIGHEIGHGFDDQGRKSDGDGVLQDWWTEEDARRFQERAQGLIDQYGTFSPVEGMFLNGELTLGENIGDLGGIEVAYHAYKLSLGGKEAPIIDGLTGDQRFFHGFAQIWKGKAREQMLAMQVASGPHSPVEFRVNGVVPNVDAWYEAFGVKPGDAMYRAPEDRVRIW